MSNKTNKTQQIDNSRNEATRRQFLKTAGVLPLVAQTSVVGLGLIGSQTAQASSRVSSSTYGKEPLGGDGLSGLKDAFSPVPISEGDRVDVSEGFEIYILAKMGDRINKAGDTFGDTCDYTAFLKGSRPDQAFLWVNHEYIHVGMLYEKKMKGEDKTKAQVDAERKMVGGSLLELKVEDGKYKLNAESDLAFRLDGTTPIPMVGVAGGETAIGTMGNCSGGQTPWGSILTAEENVDDFYDKSSPDYYGWAEHYKLNPYHYGYIVEVDPKTKSARKLTGLGRFAHEGACIHEAKNGKIVAYMGDDERFECLYKFVSEGKVTGDSRKDADLLLEGTLFVANIQKGSWEKLTPEHPDLKADKQDRFKTQRDICLNTREAGHLAGGTPLNRPEGIAIDSRTGAVLIALTNNSKAGDFHGSILAVYEKSGDHSATEFSSETVLTGGVRSGVSCPDNLVMGPGGYLWAGMDISSTSMGSGVYKAFPRNALHRIEADGEGNLHARRLLLSPPGSEVTGPSFSDTEDSLFVSIQHPGEGSYVKFPELTSRWPLGSGKPLSSVIVVQATKSSFS
jgi:secreted PhoX family phosphatase